MLPVPCCPCTLVATVHVLPLAPSAPHSITFALPHVVLRIVPDRCLRMVMCMCLVHLNNRSRCCHNLLLRSPPRPDWAPSRMRCCILDAAFRKPYPTRCDTHPTICPSRPRADLNDKMWQIRSYDCASCPLVPLYSFLRPHVYVVPLAPAPS